MHFNTGHEEMTCGTARAHGFEHIYRYASAGSSQAVNLTGGITAGTKHGDIHRAVAYA